MASSNLILIFIFSVTLLAFTIRAQIDESTFELATSALDFPTRLYGGDEDMFGVGTEEYGGASDRRSLFWRQMRYYISYGALSANRIPCPPRSGRSYYTHNCFSARGPAHPYTRGCSAITHCRR